MCSTDPRPRRPIAAAAFAAAIACAGPAWAQAVVVSASGPSARGYPAGRNLPAGSRITLNAGDSVTLLDSRGTRTLRGPGTFGADTSTTAVNRGFAALVTTQGRRRARTGAVRRPGEVAGPPSLWFVDISKDGAFCVADPAAVRLWRPDMQRAASLTIADGAGRSVTLAYPVGQNTVAWPASLPITAGRAYTLSGDAAAAPVRLRFAAIGPAGAEPVAMYKALDAQGCSNQQRLLVNALALPDTAR